MIKNEDIYEIIKKNTEYLYNKYDIDKYINNVEIKDKLRYIIKEKLYELNLNICNQAIYDYTYKFTKEDLKFIEKYNLYDEINEIITITSDYLKKYKNK